MILVVPGATPLTIPLAFTVAIDVLLLAQVPFKVVSERLIVRLANTVLPPVIGPTVGSVFTVRFFVTEVVPQDVVTAYVIVTEPALTAVTTPELFTVATAVLLLLQTPPGVGALKFVVVFSQNDSTPLKGETTGGPALTTGMV